MRIFTLEEAREVLREIMPLTDAYVERVDPLRTRFDDAKQTGDTASMERLEATIGREIHEWMLSVAAYGAQVKAAWLVDFDSGDGYLYCWHHGESDILYYHAFEACFTGRQPIALLEARLRGR
jgi:hypothetical protein